MFKFVSKHLSVLVVIIILAILFVTVKFLYKNFYETYINVEKLTVLERQVTPVSFKEKLWDEVKAAIEEKLTVKQIPQDIKDPFRP